MSTLVGVVDCVIVPVHGSFGFGLSSVVQLYSDAAPTAPGALHDVGNAVTALPANVEVTTYGRFSISSWLTSTPNE